MPSVGEEMRVWVTEDDDADSGVLSGRGVSARVLPRVNAAAALANLAGLFTTSFTTSFTASIGAARARRTERRSALAMPRR